MTQPNETTSNKSPTHVAYQVRDGKDKGFFTRIGVAWAHKDSKGYNIQLNAVPLDGKITLRVITENKE